MNSLSLFSGAGGGLLAEKYILNWRSIGYVEYNTYCQKVIAQRIKDGFLDEAPIFGDINGFIESGAAKKYKGFVDVVTGGFPCQPFSVAGKRKAQDDSRNLWPQTLTVLCDVRPRFALLENVPGLLSVNGGGYFAQILADLAESGFDARWCVLGADDVGAPHRRKRLWIVAHSSSIWSQIGRTYQADAEIGGTGKNYISGSGIYDRRQSDAKENEDVAHSQSESGDGSYDDGGISMGREQVSKSGNSGGANNVADSNSDGEKWYQHDDGQGGRTHQSGEELADSDSERGRLRETDRKDAEDAGQSPRRSEHGYWDIEPDVGRVAHGVANRVDRLKAIGNGQVPAVATTAWKILSEPNKPFN